MAGSSRKVNVEVGISGENKYKQAISELNAANKTMGAELKRLSAEYQGNSDSMEFLSKKSETLQEILDRQTEKVEQLKEAVRWASREYGEGSTKTQDYAAQLTNAETSVINLQRAIQENNKAMEQQAYSTDVYDKQLQVLSSELREIESEMAAGADAVDTLREKQEILNDILTVQEEKYRTLMAALNAALSSETASEEEINALKIQVNEAATAYNNTSAAIQKNSQALQENLAAAGNAQKGLIGIGDALDGLTNKFGVKIPDAAKTALNGMGSFSTQTVAALGAAAAGVTALYEGIKSLHTLTVEYAAMADDLITKSAQTGLSMEFLQAYEYAQNLVDVDLSTFTQAMQTLTDKMADARDGNEKLTETFKKLHVDIVDTTDGSLRPAEVVIMEVIEALHEMGNETERNATASDLFGKSYQNLNPLIVSGTKTLEEYMEAAKENYVLTEDQIKALGKLDDQVQINKNEWEALKKQIAAEFAPASKEALENFGKLVTTAGKALVESGIIEGVGEIFVFLSNMLQPLADLLSTSDTVPDRLGPVYEVLHGIAGVLAWIEDAANVCIGLIQTLSIVGAKQGLQRIGTALGYNASSGNYSNLQKWEQNYAKAYASANGNYYDSATGKWTGNYGRNAGGTDNWRGGLTWVGENGPELVNLPAGSQIHSAQESRQLMNPVIYVTIDAKNVREFNDIIEMAYDAQAQLRMR